MRNKIWNSPNLEKYNRKNPLSNWALNKFKESVLEYVEESKATKVLDVGCGEGFILKYLSEFKKFELAGIDISDGALGFAKKQLKGVKLKDGDIYDIPYEDNSFDFVLASEVLEHLENPKKAIEELKRVSSKNVLVTVPREPWAHLFEKIVFLGTFDSGHVQFWNKREFEKILSEDFKKFKTKRSTLWQIALCEI